ncbi:MAG: cryptochrome/photolyase family protein [Thermodesulfobacteriota bacterium]
MSTFWKRLLNLSLDPSGRQWIFVPYDQLTDSIGPLSRENPRNLGIVLIENPWMAAQRPYHKQKLALIFSNMRHFALEQAARGIAVRYVVADGPCRNPLEKVAGEVGPLTVMAPAERELRTDIEPLITTGSIRIVPHEGWMTTPDMLRKVEKPGPQWRMDAFYREARRSCGILMLKGKPLGGKYSHDPANRLPWKGTPDAPTPPKFQVDAVKGEVGLLITEKFSHHPGKLDLSAIPATKSDAEMLWAWAKEECLEWFGPYEDAMSTKSSGLFHTRISSLLNIHRLLPNRVVADVEALDIPIQSKEGFIRQVLGWREFVHHVHTITDGFRQGLEPLPQVLTKPGDGGYRTWAGKAWSSKSTINDPHGGACPNRLGAQNLLPPAFWGEPSGLHCLDSVVSSVWRDAYSHHITRLMVLANIATLLDVNPRQLTDWFWIAYADAYDWVVEPNVLGMGTYAVGPLMTTKPYVSGANYINRMSDFCRECQFDPENNCPITPLYWAFLARHEPVLQVNPRLSLVMKSLYRREGPSRERDKRFYDFMTTRFCEGVPVRRNDLRNL